MVLSSYICGIVLVELKLLQVICNRNVVLESRRGEKLTYSGGQKPIGYLWFGDSLLPCNASPLIVRERPYLRLMGTMMDED